MIANLSPEQQRALLAELLRQRALKGDNKATRAFSMSAGQQGLWYAYCRDPHATPFNVFLPTRIRSNLDLNALKNAIDFLTERHACLRTTFTDSSSELRQIVHEKLNPEFKVVDATHLRSDDSRMQELIVAESQRPFNLQRGPLLRLAAFRLAEDDFLVLATTHHIVVDFWSLILILAELRQSYPKFAASQTPMLPPASNNYADFVTDQQLMLSGPICQRFRDYWMEQLRDAPTILEIVSDYERPQTFTGRAGIQGLLIPAELSAAIFQLAAAARTTPFTIVQSAIQVLLSQHSGQREFLIGSPFSGRSHSKYESTVGFFVNMLPLRADLRGEPSFVEVIERTKRTLWGALEFEAYPLSSIVRDINPLRDPSRSPLFQVSCTFEKAHLRSESGRAGSLFPGESEVASLGGLQQESFYVPHQTCHYDLEFIFEQTERSVRGMICYCRDLFSADSMEMMAENYVQLLGSLLNEPNRPVFDSLAATQHHAERLTELARPTEPNTVCEMLERVAAANPQRSALRSVHKQLTYQQMMDEVKSRANELAQDLIAPNTITPPIIPVTGKSSPDILVEILGVMFSGAAVIPIDSEQPSVSPAEVRKDVSSCPPQDNPFAHLPPASAEHSPGPNDLAYVIYTSGSTGRPKGVMIEHQAICNTLRWRQEAVPLHIDDRVLMLLSHQFDAGLGIALATLTQGAELVWGTAEARHDIHALVEQLIRDQITVLTAVPSLMRLIVEHPKFCECKLLRMLWTGGEAMPRELPNLVKQRCHASLWNFYGPTETAVEAIAMQIHTHDERCSVPLGKPITGASVFVVDDALRILPDTVPGQLAITGRGLARGYLNLPQLTAERFVQLEIGGQPVRAYLTGDRGRKLKNGHFEFLGRTDHQVKLRGYRIELQEIEQHLLGHPLVAQAVVIVANHDSISAQLVGYVCLRHPTDNPQAVAAQIRRDLSLQLPAYKVPVQLIVLEALPLTASGKVDRKKLPAATFATVERTVQAPSTALEEYLAVAWCEALQIERISVDQNFFELGGSSLQAAMLTAKLTEGLGVHVPTSLLFDLADISQVARRLVQLYEVQIAERFGMNSVTAYATRRDAISSPTRSGKATTMHALIAPLKITGDRRPIFMIHPPGGIVMCYRELATRVDAQQPLYAIRSRGLHGHEELPKSIEEAAGDYISAMRSIQPLGPYRLGGWSLGGLFAFEMALQLLSSGIEVEQLLLLDTAVPDGASHLVSSQELVSAGQEYGLNLSLNELNAMHPDEQLPLLWEHAKSLGVLHDETPQEVVTQVLNDLKSLFHHHMELATRYQVRPYPGEITLIRPTEVPFAQAISPDRGWRFIARKVHVRHVGGHHHSMVQMPHAIELAAALEVV